MKEAWCNLGQSYRDLGDERRSEQAFGEALRCDPNLVSALHMRGLLRHGTGRPCAALDDFSRGLLFDPQHEGCRLMAGLVLQSMGEFSEALMHYAALLKMREPPTASESQEKLKLAGVDSRGIGGERMSGAMDAASGATGNAVPSQPASSTSVTIPSNRTWGYYLAQLSIYFRCNLDCPVVEFSPDRDVDPLFKENATKRALPDETRDHATLIVPRRRDSGDPPVAVRVPTWLAELPAYRVWVMAAMESKSGVGSQVRDSGDVVYRRSIRAQAASSSSKDSINRAAPWYEASRDFNADEEKMKAQESERIESLRRILRVCDRYGPLVQLQCKGFLANRRQHRQFGMAVISMAQAAESGGGATKTIALLRRTTTLSLVAVARQEMGPRAARQFPRSTWRLSRH